VLAHLAILPVAVFFIMSRLALNAAALRILWYVLATTAIALAVAWIWLWKSKLPPKTKGALLIAAGFGNVLFLGLPLNKALIGDWSMRVAVEYGLVADVLLLFTAGAVLSRSFTESGKPKFKGPANEVLKDHRVWLKEPLVWAALAGLVFNLGEIKLPSWSGSIEVAIHGLLMPLLLLTAALAVSWNQAWKAQWVSVLPVAGIQLVLVPLVMWGMVSLFGSPGAKTAQALVLDSMMPATLLGFVACDRYKLDTAGYTLVFSLTSALAIVTVPIWFNLLY
jgi:predicted permease